jgi:DNA-binding HxlR family transcriptional regulator
MMTFTHPILPGILRHLERDSVETAKQYQLTELGRSLDDPLEACERWVDSNGISLKQLDVIGIAEPRTSQSALWRLANLGGNL